MPPSVAVDQPDAPAVGKALVTQARCREQHQIARPGPNPAPETFKKFRDGTHPEQAQREGDKPLKSAASSCAGIETTVHELLWRLCPLTQQKSRLARLRELADRIAETFIPKWQLSRQSSLDTVVAQKS